MTKKAASVSEPTPPKAADPATGGAAGTPATDADDTRTAEATARRTTPETAATTTVPDPEIRAEAEARARKRAEARRLAAPMRMDALPSRPQFSQPVRQIVMMLVVLGLVGAGGFWAYARIWPIFAANLWLNGLIFGVFVAGVLACFWQVGQLIRSVSWIERFAARHRNATAAGIGAEPDATSDKAPLLLAPLAALLGTRGPAGAISTSSARSMQDSVATRIEEARDITRYLANLLIFLGLLGTFYGLATTVPAVVETIRALAPQEGESAIELFDKLMAGLEGQLGGMAVAFSSSLLGLAGSLVVGLLELFVSHGQNRFFRELEEWMTSFTRVGLAEGADGTDRMVLADFADRLADHIRQLSDFYALRDRMGEQDQIAADERALLMARAVDQMAARAEADAEVARNRAEAMHRLTARLADGQDRMIALSEIAAEDRALAQDAAAEAGGDVRARLRSLDLQMARLAEDTDAARLTAVAELRADIATLTRAVLRLGDNPTPGGR